MEEAQVGTSDPVPPTEALRGEDRYISSDYHLGEGLVIRRKIRPSWFRRTFGNAPEAAIVRKAENPLEDFYREVTEEGVDGVKVIRKVSNDEAFAAFMRKIVRDRRPGCDVVKELNGDIFDFLAVSWKDRVDRDPPKERCALIKFGKIVAAHPVFFEALAEFLRKPHTRLEFTVGNHDQDFDWPAVQRAFIELVSGGDPALAAKVLIIDRTHDYMRLHRKVLKTHGFDCEFHNSIDPRNSILTDHLGVPLKEPVLNRPVGSILTVRLANLLKLYNHFVGRIPDETVIWLHALMFDWRWSLLVIVMFAWVLLSNMVTKFWDVRYKAGPIAVIRIAYASWKSENPLKLMEKLEDDLLKRFPAAKVIVDSHIHHAYRKTTSESTRVNTGNWSKRTRLVDPPIEYRWGSWRGLERVIRRLQRLNAKQRSNRIWRSLVSAIAAVAFTATSFVEGGFRLSSYGLADLVLPAKILFWGWLVAFAFRTIAVKPDEEDATELTFARIRHDPDDAEEKGMRVDLMVYRPEEDAFHEV